MEPSERLPLVVTIGGGGAIALGFALGVTSGLRDEGIDISKATLVGTSGGSHAAVAIASGMSYDTIDPIWRNYVEHAGKIWVKAYPLAEELYGTAVVSDVAGVAVRILGFRREVLWAPGTAPANLVAASSSPFPFARPHKIGKRRYIDGGHRSGTSADLAPAADLQLVLAALMDPRQGFLGKLGARQARKEVGKWTAATGGATVLVGPNDAIAEMKVKGMKSMGDIEVGRTVLELAVPIGRELAGTLRRDHPTVVERLPTPS
jgi:hypothetical protein